MSSVIYVKAFFQLKKLRQLTRLSLYKPLTPIAGSYYKLFVFLAVFLGEGRQISVDFYIAKNRVSGFKS